MRDSASTSFLAAFPMKVGATITVMIIWQIAGQNDLVQRI